MGFPERARLRTAAFDAEVRVSLDADDQAREDDGRAVLQEWKRIRHGEDAAIHVPAEDVAVTVFGGLAEQQHAAASIGKENINAAVLRSDLILQPVQIFHLSGICD